MAAKVEWLQYIRKMKDDEFSPTTQQRAAHKMRFFLCFMYGVTRQEIKLYLPPVIYFIGGWLNEVIVCLKRSVL